MTCLLPHFIIMCWCFLWNTKVTLPFKLLSDPDGDDDTKRNNKCWLIWEVSIHILHFHKYLVIVILVCDLIRV